MKLSRRQMLATSAACSVASVPVVRGWEVDRSRPTEFTPKSMASIKKGTQWLLKALNRDGGAGLDIATPSDVACTSVVGMAFLSQGSTPVQGTYWRQQKKVAQFLLRAVENMSAGGKMQSFTSQIEGDLGPYATHFFSTIFLSQTMGEAPSITRYQQAIARLEQYISAGQHKNGSWGSNAWAPMLATACGWISLRAANFAGVSVSGSSDNAAAYIIKKMPRLGKKWGGGSWYHRLYATAAGLRVLYALGRENEPKAVQALEDIMALLQTRAQPFGQAGGEEYLTFHLLTEMLMQEGGKRWAAWYPLVRDNLIKYQNRDGSWTGHHCITSRTFSTACALMVLTAPNRYLPISQV